ncbi:MAG TPA: TRAP transporter small permease [Rhizobiaceae bacterium]|nr:TRAP transporter small permease [Rhizobiaceae bacterium]
MIDAQEPANRASAALAIVERALVAVSSICLGMIMLIVVADVTMRYFFHAPFSWSYDLIGLYLMVAVFFFALSDTLHNHGHIAIDIFQHSLPQRVRHVSMAIGYLLSTVILALITWQAWIRLQTAYLGDDRIAAAIPWPTWISYFIVTLGGAVVTLRCLYRTIGHAASAATGRELVETPPPPETGHGPAEGAE